MSAASELIDSDITVVDGFIGGGGAVKESSLVATDSGSSFLMKGSVGDMSVVASSAVAVGSRRGFRDVVVAKAIVAVGSLGVVVGINIIVGIGLADGNGSRHCGAIKIGSISTDRVSCSIMNGIDDVGA